jgi:hypothetical protein
MKFGAPDGPPGCRWQRSQVERSWDDVPGTFRPGSSRLLDGWATSAANVPDRVVRFTEQFFKRLDVVH